MHGVEAAAWADVLGVGQKELPWALQARIRVLEDTQSDVNRVRQGLRDASDEEFVILLESACRSLAAAGERLASHLTDMRRLAS